MLCHWSYSSICLPRILTDHCFLIVEFIRQQTRAESKGVEPLYRFTDSLGLANLHITALSTLQKICGERGNRTPGSAFGGLLFSSRLRRDDQPDSLHGVSDKIPCLPTGRVLIQPKGNSFTDRHDSASSSHSPHPFHLHKV